MRLGGRGLIVSIGAVCVILFVSSTHLVLDRSAYVKLFNIINNLMKFKTDININQYDITIVTMYLNIGSFDKGSTNYRLTPDTYKNYMKSWAWLTNKVIGYFDTNESMEIFRTIRSSQPEDRTVLIKINRTDLPAFDNLEKIKQIYANPWYPKHLPNTVVAEYSCAMNAKYDVLQMAMMSGLVNTDYIAWLDIGLFRHLPEPNRRPAGDRFTLEIPDNFNSSCVSMSEVGSRNDLSKTTPWQYISENIVWVSGAFMVATKQNVWKFSESYKWTVNELLKLNQSSTDQQVIGAMYSPTYIQRQPVDMNPYRCSDGQFGLYSSDIAYFCMGYVFKDAAEKRQQTVTTQTLT